MGKGVEGISKGAMECLESYQWPGNVRELENVLERAVALETGETIHPESLPREVRNGKFRRGEVDVVLPESGIDLERHLEELRRRFMIEAMDRSGSVQTRAAEILGMTFRSFRYFAKKYGLTVKDLSAGPAVDLEHDEPEAWVAHAGEAVE
jgi:two-component system response regulator PilR (NtrC family)